MITGIEQQATIYTYHENGIHEYKFVESSIRAVDQWIIKAEEIIAQTPPDQTICSLYDQTKSGMVPLSYAYKQLEAMMKRYPDRSQTKTAYVVRPGFVISLVDAFNKLMRSGHKDQVKFYFVDKRDEAVTWLLSND